MQEEQRPPLSLTGRTACGTKATVEWEEEVTYIEDEPCQPADPEEVPKGKHWLRKGKVKGHTESEIRAFRKRVAKRRAKKKRK